MTTTDDLVKYDVTAAEIGATRERYAALSADTPAGYEEVRLAIGHLRTTRTAIEKRRVDLKADALSFGRKVDNVAKELTALIEELEEPLRAKKAEVEGDLYRLTDAGRSETSDIPPWITPKETVEGWKANLTGKARDALEIFAIEHGPITDDQLSERLGIERTLSTYRAVKAQLSTNGLIRRTKGGFVVADELRL